ncbi:hypothetical protein [Bifidobacterium adolescentis]|jgi:hypothetical protein|uniref:hypothetical protein n=1 Tax=Bifidobacterium adolescentis TaxID=1680 RepID=UPI00069A93F1|nr:hypothetical protein [Bifidobacterium adolescentis]
MPSAEDPVEWDETERDWMRALDLYEKLHECPLCGLSTDLCHDQGKVDQLFAGAQVETCWITFQRERAMRKYEESGTVLAPHAQTANLIPRN